jgi:hypothetical protein
MLKIPTFIIGGILVLTGLVGYLVQDPGLTLKLKGPLASDASFVLSDGVDKHSMDFIPCPESAGENVWWIAHKLNEDHARVASQKNFATENGANENELHSFWYASSRGETMKGLLLESERYNSAGSENNINIDWTKIDIETSSLRIIYKNIAGNEGPVTLTSNNWENVDIEPLPQPGEALTFSKSWTAFIPGIIGLLLILLAQGAEMAPNARKHIMHVAVLVGLLGFIVSAGKIGSAVAEMNWLKGEPYGIIHASMLKPLSMLLTSGLLFIYVLLCIISFVNARKEMAANKKAEEEKKKKVLQKVKRKNESVDLEKKNASDPKSPSTPDKKLNSTETGKKPNDQAPEAKNEANNAASKKDTELKKNLSSDKPQSSSSKVSSRDPSKGEAKPKTSIQKPSAQNVVQTDKTSSSAEGTKNGNDTKGEAKVGTSENVSSPAKPVSPDSKSAEPSKDSVKPQNIAKEEAGKNNEGNETPPALSKGDPVDEKKANED